MVAGSSAAAQGHIGIQACGVPRVRRAWCGRRLGGGGAGRAGVGGGVKPKIALLRRPRRHLGGYPLQAKNAKKKGVQRVPCRWGLECATHTPAAEASAESADGCCVFLSLTEDPSGPGRRSDSQKRGENGERSPSIGEVLQPLGPIGRLDGQKMWAPFSR